MFIVYYQNVISTVCPSTTSCSCCNVSSSTDIALGVLVGVLFILLAVSIIAHIYCFVR